MEASVLDLRKRMREVMMAIDRHETVPLTHRGKRRAVIVPWGKTKKAKVKVADLSAFALVFATACEHSLTLCSANQKHFRSIRSLDSKVFKPEKS